MPETDHATAAAAHSPDAALLNAAAAPFLTSEGVEAGPGQRWNRFTLRAAVPGVAHTYLAEDVGQMEKVLINARLISDRIEWRRRAWAQLCPLSQLSIVRGVDVIEELGWRYEIMAAPSPMNLREWIAVHRPGFEEVEVFVRQLSSTLAALHAEGLVHLNLRPDAIHIVEAEGGPQFVLGGLHAVTLFNQPDLIPIEVDPFYAPPEAAGLSHHAPGDHLCAWDWWSLGRVVQEMMLGQHVLGMLLHRDVSRPTPELRTRAEMLLLEREPVGIRAGAVEHMNAEPAAQPLLRGLLTGSCDARWRGDAVERWLKSETVREHYDLPRTTRLWRLNGRVFTLDDAAAHFTRAEHWSAGEETLFHAEEPGTLAHFLKGAADYRETWERLNAVLAMVESPAWAAVPVTARRTLGAAIGWLVLANASGARQTLRIRGQGTDTAGLLQLLQVPGGADSVALFQGLIHPPVIELIESLDPVAGRMLKAVSGRGGGALKLALEHGWLDADDAAGFARLFRLSLERAAVLQERAALLQATYATSRYPELARMLSSRTATPVEYVVLAFTGDTPEQCGFVTHADWRNERYHVLRSEAELVANALRWVRLNQLYHYAWLWGVSWKVFGSVVAGLALVTAALGQSLDLGGVVVVALLLSRAWLWWRVRAVFRRDEPQAPAWSWRDGRERAAAESHRLLSATQTNPAALAGRMHTLRAGMSEFAAEARRVPPPADPQWWDVAAVLGAATVVTVAAFLLAIATPRFDALPPAIDAALPTEPAPPLRTRVENVDRTLRAESVADPEALLATGHYEIVDDGFGRRLRGPLRKWDHYAPARVTTLRIQARAPASAEQTAFARVNAALLLRPYLSRSINALIAIRVPTTRGLGLLIFNARDRQPFAREVLLVRGTLQENTWYEVDGLRVFYLGNPLPLDATISLAPP